jgi:hypothetical protein
MKRYPEAGQRLQISLAQQELLVQRVLLAQPVRKGRRVLLVQLVLQVQRD